MRVFAITQRLRQLEIQIETLRESGARAVRAQRGQVIADRAIVGCRVRKSFLRQPEAGRLADRAVGCAHFAQYCSVVGGIGHYRNVRVVLARAAHHRRPADIDIFDRFVQRRAGAGDGLAKGIEIDDHQVDRRDTGAFDRLDMRGNVAPREYAAVNFRVQGFDAAVEHLRKTGMVRHLGDADPAVAQQFGGAAGRQHRDAETGEAARELDETGFVGNA